MERGKRPIVVKRYSQSFRQGIVEQVEGGLSIEEASRRHGVSKTSIYKWLRRYGKHEVLLTKVVVMNQKEQDQEKALRAKIKQLEAALVNSQLAKQASEAYLELACEQLKCGVEEFKKKSSEKR